MIIDRSDMSNPMITSCDFIRVALPFSEMEIQEDINILYCNRMPSGGPGEMRRLQSEGWKVIVDIDDYWHVETNNPYYEKQKLMGIAQVIYTCLKDADHVVASTAHLADKILPFQKNVTVIPNALPFDKGQYSPVKSNHGRSKFLWAGSSCHRDDLRLLPDGFDLTIAGFDRTNERWREIIAEHPGVKVQPHLLRQKYFMHYEGHAVSLAPLVDSPFNRCKSNLKMLEAGAKKMAFIASDVLPYANSVDDKIVTYASGRDGFRKEMNLLDKNPSLIADNAERLAEHVRKNYQLSDANKIRQQLIDHLRP